MAKKIAYSACSYGIDGREKRDVLYASFDEQERDQLVDKDPSKAWRYKEEEIVDVEKVRKQALSKLNGIEILVLGLPNWLDEN